jgi:hypothetical protein
MALVAGPPSCFKRLILGLGREDVSFRGIGEGRPRIRPGSASEPSRDQPRRVVTDEGHDEERHDDKRHNEENVDGRDEGSALKIHGRIDPETHCRGGLGSTQRP